MLVPLGGDVRDGGAELAEAGDFGPEVGNQAVTRTVDAPEVLTVNTLVVGVVLFHQSAAVPAPCVSKNSALLLPVIDV